MTVLYIFLAILIFGFLIFIHEGGHYLFARLFKVKIREFAIGMGPKILSHTSKKTGIVYSWRALPFGGFLAMEGEDDESDDDNAFYKKHPLKRILITFAGAFVNIVVGILIMSILVGTADEYSSAVVAEFNIAEDAESSSMQFGLSKGDRILEVGGADVYTGNDVWYEIMRRGNKPVSLLIERNGEEILLEDVVFPTITNEGVEFGEPDFKVYREDKTFSSTVKNIYSRTRSSIKMVYESLFDLISGRYNVKNLSGPVGVTKVLADEAAQSSFDFIFLASFISINLGLMNLLPIPALDGGRILFLLIELITKKRVPVKVESIINFAGLGILMLLMIFVTCKDIIQLF